MISDELKVLREWLKSFSSALKTFSSTKFVQISASDLFGHSDKRCLVPRVVDVRSIEQRRWCNGVASCPLSRSYGFESRLALELWSQQNVVITGYNLSNSRLRLEKDDESFFQSEWIVKLTFRGRFKLIVHGISDGQSRALSTIQVYKTCPWCQIWPSNEG